MSRLARAHSRLREWGTVGMVGLTTGGGYGPLTSRYGLALDNLLAAEVVLGDGWLVICGEHENPDLFWEIRGGSGNFGVITSMRVRLHPFVRSSRA